MAAPYAGRGGPDQYGDTRIIRENLPTIKKWLEAYNTGALHQGWATTVPRAPCKDVSRTLRKAG